jgi:hypothetical protein
MSLPARIEQLRLFPQTSFAPRERQRRCVSPCFLTIDSIVYLDSVLCVWSCLIHAACCSGLALDGCWRPAWARPRSSLSDNVCTVVTEPSSVRASTHDGTRGTTGLSHGSAISAESAPNELVRVGAASHSYFTSSLDEGACSIPDGTSCAAWIDALSVTALARQARSCGRTTRKGEASGRRMKRCRSSLAGVGFGLRRLVCRGTI